MQSGKLSSQRVHCFPQAKQSTGNNGYKYNIAVYKWDRTERDVALRLRYWSFSTTIMKSTTRACKKLIFNYGLRVPFKI